MLDAPTYLRNYLADQDRPADRALIDEARTLLAFTSTTTFGYTRLGIWARENLGPILDLRDATIDAGRLMLREWPGEIRSPLGYVVATESRDGSLAVSSAVWRLLGQAERARETWQADFARTPQLAPLGVNYVVCEIHRLRDPKGGRFA